jgi:Mce-associated membrane protein
VAKAKAQRTVQTAAVAAVAVERAEPGRVEVLMFVNTGTVKKITGKAEPRQQVSQNRARFVMIKQGSRWLVADLSTLIGTA